MNRTLLVLAAVSALTVLSNAQLPDPVCVPASLKSTPVLRNLQGLTMPRPLLNARAAGTLPEKLPTDILLSLEGGTYFWLYRQIFNLLGWAPCPLVSTPMCLAQPGTGNPPNAIPYCAPSPEQVPALFAGGAAAIVQFCTGCRGTSFPTPDGWQLLAVLNVTANYTALPAQAPFGAVLKPSPDNTAAKQLVVVLRGSAFTGDSLYSDRYKQTPAGPYGAGSVHEGYKDMAEQMWGPLAAVLDAEIVNGAADVTDILLGGHSVGGGVGMLLSTRAQSYLAAECAQPGKCRSFPSRTNPKVSLVTFGSVNVGDAAYADDFNIRINARVIDYDMDRTQQFLITRFPIILVGNALQLPNPLEKYVRVGGAVPLTGSDMPYQPDIWSSIWYPGASDPWPSSDLAFAAWGGLAPGSTKYVQIAQGALYPVAQVYSASTHVCVYMCKMST